MNEVKKCKSDIIISTTPYLNGLVSKYGNKESLKIALYRIVFEEFLILQLGLFMFKNGTSEVDGIKFTRDENLDKILGALPFKLTNAQNRA